MAEKVHFNGKPLIPSKYLEAADLSGQRVTVVIERIAPKMELQSPTGKKDTRPVFFLRGKNKGWVLNKTNLNRLAEVYGAKADTWIGKPVVLYAERVESFGSMVPAVRVDVEMTRQVFEKGPSNRANGNGKSHKPAPDQSRQRQPSDDIDDASSEPPHDENGVVQEGFDYGPPAMTDEQQRSWAGDDEPGSRG